MNHSPKFCCRFIKPFIKVINKKKEVETISILFLSIKHFLNLSHSSLKFKIFFPIRLQCSLFLNPWIVCRSEQKTGARLIVFLQRNQSGIKQFGRIHALHARLGHFRQYQALRIIFMSIRNCCWDEQISRFIILFHNFYKSSFI